MPRIIKKYSKIALVLGLILVLIVMFSFAPTAQAGNLSKEKDTLSDSRPTQNSDHTIMFVIASDITQGETVTVKPDASGNAFNLTGVTEDDVDLEEDDDGGCDGSWTEEETVSGAAQAAEWGVSIDTDEDEIEFTAPSNAATYLTGGNCVKIVIGDAADHDGDGSNQIDNPAAGTYDITITTSDDSGLTYVAIVSGVTVSAIVSESFSFAISGETNSNCDTSFTTYGGPDTDATLVAFGTLSSLNTFYHACQDLTVSTNAGNGFAVTAHELTNLMYSTYTFNDSTGDNGTMDEDTSDTWGTATGHPGFGFSCADISGSDCAFSYTNYRQFACTSTTDAYCDPGSGSETPQTVMSKGGAADGDECRIEYKITADASQEAGDYSNTIVYIATPTY